MHAVMISGDDEGVTKGVYIVVGMPLDGPFIPEISALGASLVPSLGPPHSSASGSPHRRSL